MVVPPLLPPSQLTRQFGGRGERKHPLAYYNLRVTDWGIRIDPGKHRFAGLPQGLMLKRMILDYGCSFSFDWQALRVRRVVMLRPGRIEPDRYKEFLELCRKVDDFESRRIRLSP